MCNLWQAVVTPSAGACENVVTASDPTCHGVGYHFVGKIVETILHQIGCTRRTFVRAFVRQPRFVAVGAGGAFGSLNKFAERHTTAK